MRAGMPSIKRGSRTLVSRKSGEVVDSKAQLVAVLAGLSLTGSAARADASIVDENVEPVTFLADGVGEATHLCERGKICG